MVLLRKLIFAAILLVLVGGVFQSVRSAGSVWRDPLSLKEAGLSSQALAEQSPMKQIRKLWQPVRGERFSPVAPTIWRIYVRSVGLSAEQLTQALHVLSLTVHAANVILVFLLLSLLLQSEWAAFLGAALFGVHPLQVEAVAYLSAFRFLVGSFFAIIAIQQYLNHVLAMRAGRKHANLQRPYWLATAALILAMLSQPIFVTIPIVAALLVKLLPKQTALYSAKPGPWRLGLWWLLVLPVMIWEFIGQNTSGLSQNLPFWSRPLIAGDSISFYLNKFLVPRGIGPDYGHSPFFVMSHWWGYLMWVVPVVIYIAAARHRSKGPAWYREAVLLFVTLLLPVSGILYFSAQANSTVASRYAYLSLLAPVVGLSYLVSRARRAALPLAMSLAVVGCAWLSSRDLSFWKNDDVLWPHALIVNPGSPIAHEMLGNNSYRAGDWKKAREHYKAVISANVLDSAVYYNLAEIERQHGSPKEAAAYYNRALQLNPKLASIHRHLGEVYLAMDDTDQALAQFDAAVAEQPSDSDSLRLLGMLYVRKEQYARAIPYLNKVLELADKSKVTAEVQALLGAALFKTNQQALAQEHLRIALEQFPNNEEANRQLGDIYFDQGLFAEAKSNYERVLAHGKGTFEVFEHLGRIHSGRKEYSKAAHYFNSALASKSSDAETLKNLGVSHFHQRQYKDAISCFNKALAADPDLAEPYFFLGDLARWQGKEAEAIRNYQMAIKIDTNFSDAHYRLGNLYLKKNQLQQAITQFQAGLHSAPLDPKLSYALRQATQSQGKAEM